MDRHDNRAPAHQLREPHVLAAHRVRPRVPRGGARGALHHAHQHGGRVPDGPRQQQAGAGIVALEPEPEHQEHFDGAAPPHDRQGEHEAGAASRDLHLLS